MSESEPRIPDSEFVEPPLPLPAHVHAEDALAETDVPAPDDAWPDGERFTAHELRHTFATWLDAAGVRGTVRSMLLGHSTGPRDGSAQVTARYTHALPGDLELAREQLDTYLAADAARRGATG